MFAQKKITANARATTAQANWQEVKKAMSLSLYQEKKEIAIKLIKQGAALDFISRVTYLTKSELLHLVRET